MSDKEYATWKPEQHWYRHQLRHNAATFLRKEFGLETARVTLGTAQRRLRRSTQRWAGRRQWKRWCGWDDVKMDYCSDIIQCIFPY